MKKRVYLVGDAFGSYRARALLEYLAASPIYTFIYTDPRYLKPEKPVFISRFLFKMASILDGLYGLWKLLFADVVYVLPMSNLTAIERFFVKIFSKKVIAEFYISKYDTYVNDWKTVKAESYKAKKLIAHDRVLIDATDIIIFLNSLEKTFYLDLIGRSNTEKEIHTVSLCTANKKMAQLPYANSTCDEIVLCWWGTFIPLHGLDKIVASAKILKKMNVKFKLYLFGTSDALSEPYKKYIVKEDLTGYVIIDNKKNFSDGTLEDFLVTKCDVAFGNFGDSDKAKTVMVNKVVEAASMGIPVISQKTAALNEYFQDKNNIIFSESTPESIADSVIYLSSNKDLLKTLSNQSYHLYTMNFTKEIYIRKIAGILANAV